MAMRVALSQKLRENRLFVVSHLRADEIKTKTVANILRDLEWTTDYHNVLLVHGGEAESEQHFNDPDSGLDANLNFERSVRNIPNVDFRKQLSTSVYYILKFEYLVLTTRAVDLLAKRTQPMARREWATIEDLLAQNLLPPTAIPAVPPLVSLSSSSSSSSGGPPPAASLGA